LLTGLSDDAVTLGGAVLDNMAWICKRGVIALTA
jgi:hypothetical protein